MSGLVTGFLSQFFNPKRPPHRTNITLKKFWEWFWEVVLGSHSFVRSDRVGVPWLRCRLDWRQLRQRELLRT